MKLTNFKRLRNAVSHLDTQYTRTMIAELVGLLEGKGQPFHPDDVAITEEAIYYIHPESGLATKVALYEEEQRVNLEELGISSLASSGYDDPEIYDEFHEYHLLKCNILQQARSQGWHKRKYRTIQRKDGLFPYRLIIDQGDRSDGQLSLELKSQRLNVCSNCLTKINSLLGGDANYTQRDFSVRAFLDAGFEARWQRRLGYSRKRGSLADIYPKDWEEISRKRKKQAGYICESCNLDFSKSELRRFLTIHHTDHLSDKVSFVRLQCFCLGCCAEEVGREKIKQTYAYREFLAEVKGEDPQPRAESGAVPDWQMLFIRGDDEEEEED